MNLEEGILDEAGLSRIWQHTKESDFAIITAFRGNKDLKENRARNKKLESDLKSKHLGFIKLVGHWAEAPDDIDFEKAEKEGRLQDVSEESLFIPAPKGMDTDDFENTILGLTKKYNQDASIFGTEGSVYILYKTGKKDKIGSKFGINNAGTIYSQMRNQQKGNKFIFEGTVKPSGFAHAISMRTRGYI